MPVWFANTYRLARPRRHLHTPPTISTISPQASPEKNDDPGSTGLDDGNNSTKKQKYGDRLKFLNAYNHYKGEFYRRVIWCKENDLNHRVLQLVDRCRGQLVDITADNDILF
ncbi:hypothetical protein K501DRAFT_274915 [Backusella circina FSU 941]|nr:hypothetical protein K501DRAFT_274915 [Backusella circina FSU 941]